MSVHGYLIGFGALIILVLNIIWLTVYTPKNNTQLSKVRQLKTIYASIIGIFCNTGFNEHTDYVVLDDGNSDIGIKLYGNTFNIINMPMLILSLLFLRLVHILFSNSAKAIK